MTGKASITVRLLFSLALVSVPVAADSQVLLLPPCCTTPRILEEIASRPQDEPLIEFKQWLDDRKLSPIGSSWRRDVSALLGACAQGCPPKYAIARDYLTAQIAPGTIEELMPKPAQISAREEPRQNFPPATPRSRLAVDASTEKPLLRRNATSELTPALKNQFLRNLLDWKQEPDQIPAWTQKQLVGTRDSELVDLDAYLSGACSTGRTCPANLVIGLQAIRAVREQRNINQQESQKANERRDAASARYKDRLLQAVFTIGAAIFGGLLTLAATVYAQRKSKHESENYRMALKDILRWSAAENRTKLSRIRRKRIPSKDR